MRAEFNKLIAFCSVMSVLSFSVAAYAHFAMRPIVEKARTDVTEALKIISPSSADGSYAHGIAQAFLKVHGQSSEILVQFGLANGLIFGFLAVSLVMLSRKYGNMSGAL